MHILITRPSEVWDLYGDSLNRREVTQAGLDLARASRDVDQLSRADQGPVRRKEDFRRPCSPWAPPTSGILITPEALGSFMMAMRNLHVPEVISSSLEEWLFDRRVDVAILHNPLPLEGMNLLPVLQENRIPTPTTTLPL
jgi:LysR family transcriptional regulator, nitrogen assimilation regulatory protein